MRKQQAAARPMGRAKTAPAPEPVVPRRVAAVLSSAGRGVMARGAVVVTRIEQAMAAAVLRCYEAGTIDPDTVRQAQLDARQAELDAIAAEEAGQAPSAR